LLRSTRQYYHRRIAHVLTTQFPDRVVTQPELAAYHYTEAGLHAEAVGYWLQAGQIAQERSAHEEAIAHLHKGLQVLMALPETRERDQQELTFYIALGKSLTATKGWAAPEAESTYARRRQQAKSLDLRAATSLARLWQSQGKRQEAHDLLAPVYNWFTEGLETADLQDAKALLETL
jgi:predicted ATPase